MPERDELTNRQELLANFGEFATRSEDLDEVLMEACRLAAIALGTQHAKISEIQEGQHELLVHAGVGWVPDIVGKGDLMMTERCSEGYSIRARRPVRTRDIAHEDRFEIPAFMKEAGIVAFVNVPIFVPGDHFYGILEVEDTKPRDFDNDEIQFLRTCATILGPAIDRLHLVDERKRSRNLVQAKEAKQSFLLGLDDELRSMTDAEDIHLTALRQLGEYLSVHLLGYYETGSDENEFILVASWEQGLPRLPERKFLADYGEAFRTKLRAGRTIVIRDTETSTASDGIAAATRAIDVLALIGVPLVKEGRLAAVLCVHSSVPRDWTEIEVRLVEELAERIWSAVERARAEAALRESEQKYRSLFERMGQGYLEIELIRNAEGRAIDQRYLEVNPAFEQLTGIPVAQALGRTANELVPGFDQWWHDAFGKVATTGKPERFEHIVAALDRWFEVSAYPRVGDVVAVLYDDVTQRKRDEFALRQSEERQAFLLKVSDALRSSIDADKAIASAARLLGEKLQASHVVFTEIHERVGLAYVREGWTVEGARPHAITLRLGDFAGPLLDDLRKGRTIRYDDVGEPPYARPDFAALAAYGARSGLGVPLIVGGRLVVVVNVHQQEPRSWTNEEVTLVEGVAQRIWDAVERVRAAQALRNSEERQRMMIELVPALLWSSSSDREDIRLNERWSTYTGLTEPNTQDYGWLDIVHPNDRPATRKAFEHAFATGQPLEQEHRIRKADGSYRWHLVRQIPVHDERGRISRWFGAAVDIHERKAAERALNANERWLQTLMGGMPLLVWRAGAPGLWSWSGPQWEEFTGQSEAESRGSGWLDPVHPNDRERVREVWSGATERGEFHADYRIWDAEEQRYRWFQTRAKPVRGEQGTIIEWLGTSTDVDDLRRLQDLQRTLLAELQHRVRNILGVIRSMIRRSSDHHQSLGDYVQHIEGRLGTLARTQVILTQSVDARADLEDLIRDELVAQAADDKQVTLSGGKVHLGAKVAEVFSLAIHELTTNAVKYGALSRPSASLDIAWTVEEREDERWLTLTWSETGVPMVGNAPHRSGFGTELITRRVPYELRGKGLIEMRPDGIECVLEFPLREQASILQTDAPISSLQRTGNGA